MSSNRDIITPIHRGDCISLTHLPQNGTYRKCNNLQSIDRRNRQ
jgi:hypothetical protein